MRNLLTRRRSVGGFTPPPAVTSRFWVGGTGTWDQSTTTHWSATSGGAGGASVPTQYNDVIFDANSGAGTVTLSANAPCNSFTTVGSTITAFTHNASVTLSIGSNSAAGPSSKAIDLSGLTTYTKGGGSSSIIAFVATVPTQQTIHYGTQSVASQQFTGAGGSWKLLTAMTGGASAQHVLTAGALDTNGFAVVGFSFVITGSSTRGLTLGASTMTLTSGSNGAWDATTTTGLTFSGASSTITMSGAAGAGAQVFRGGSLAYGTVNLTGTGTAIVTGSNSYTTFTRSNAAACGLRFIHATTQTIPTAAGFTISGTAGNLVTVDTDSAGVAASISIASGTVNANFLSLKDSAAVGGATFHAGAGSTNVSGNSGWIFP